ncbi:MAG: efflux RND transporter periplasmic adaptor subunit [Thermodesulfobacteriota bacterium]|nr:efflux RND transporter periplasmic adaptor subunit [Thermodesulfobacteriota bacterium]
MTCNNTLKTVVIPLIILLLCVSAGCRDKEVTASKTVAQKVGKPVVDISEVTRMDVHPEIQATGTLVPHRHAKISALAGGRLEKLQVGIGQHVDKGEVLFQVRTVDYRIGLSQAQARLAQAQARLKEAKREKRRASNLFREGSATQQMRDKADSAFEYARASVEQAVAARDRARQALEDCTIFAPYSGVITERWMEEGENVSPGVPVIEIMDLKVLDAEIHIPEVSVCCVDKEMRVTIRTTQGDPIDGRVVAVNPSIDPSTRTFLVKVRVDNHDLGLDPGLFVIATFELSVVRGVIAVPAAALVRDQGRSYVWVIKDRHASLQVVEENGTYKGLVWIVSGVEPGMSVVTVGAGALAEGVEVEYEQDKGTQ